MENGRLKKLVAERDLEIEVMKEVAANGERAGSPAASGRPGAWPRRGGPARCRASGASIGVGVSQPKAAKDAPVVTRMKELSAQYPRNAIGASAFSSTATAIASAPAGRTGCGKRQGCSAAQAAEEAHNRCAAATPASTEWAEPGFGVTTSCSTIAPMVSSSSA